MSIAVLEYIPPMLIVASAMTTASVELVTIARTTEESYCPTEKKT
jgi:hypothetical protein